MGPVQEKIIEITNRIPQGYVTNYGTIAQIVQEELGTRITARVVGWQLSGLPEHSWMLLPWWRVIAKTGFVSALKLGDKGWKQINLLEKEGIVVENNIVDMEIYMCDLNLLTL